MHEGEKMKSFVSFYCALVTIIVVILDVSKITLFASEENFSDSLKFFLMLAVVSL